MSHAARLAFVAIGLIANTVLAVLWARGGVVVIDEARSIMANLGVAGGPFTGSLDMLEVVVPVFVALIYVILIGFLVFSPVEEERARARVRL
jgi:hypothetical protein